MFGEIQSFQSRAVSDDEDDEYSLLQEDETIKRKIHWTHRPSFQETKIKVDELVLADGPLSAAFSYTYLLSHSKETNAKIIGITATKSEQKVYETNREAIESKDSSKLRNNFIYHIDNLNGKSFIVCQLYSQLKPDELYNWIDQLWSRLEFNSSLVICSQNKSNFFGEPTQKFPCVKYISSEKSNLNPGLYLEEPNFVAGLSAAMMHFCLLKKIPFSTFVCYASSINIDLPSVKRLFECVSVNLKEKNFFIENERTKKTLLSVENVVASNSSLYM
jgi:hypothetical protein